MAVKTQDTVLDVAVMTPSEFKKKWERHANMFNMFFKDLREMSSTLVQLNNDIVGKRAELAALKMDIEKARKEFEIHKAGVHSSQAAIINDITKERLELANEKRRLEVMRDELNRKALGA